MSDDGYGRSNPAPTCPCGQPSVWITGRGRFCDPCLPASAALWLLRGLLARRVNAAFAAVQL